MPFQALARSALVHPDVQEPLTVELHGDSASRPFKHGRPPRGWRAENFRKIVQPGFDLTYMYGRSFELAFETRGHLIDFNFGDAASVMQINRSKQEVFRFRPYMTSFAPAGTELYRQALAPETAAEDNRLVALNVAPDYLAGLVADMLDGREVRFVEMSQPERWPRMDRLQSAFLALFEAPRRFCALTAEALANDAIMRALMRWSSVGNRIVPTRFRTDDEAVRRAVDVIQANLRAPLSLADIAQAAQRDTTILVHVFKLATGRTPYAYLIESRIEAARHELRGTTLPIAEIARLYCFSSPSHFSTTFRKLTGMTPKAYREMARS